LSGTGQGGLVSRLEDLEARGKLPTLKLGPEQSGGRNEFLVHFELKLTVW